MSHYQPINDLCANCGRPPGEHQQYRDAKPPRCPNPVADPRCTCGAAHYRDRPHSIHCPVAVAALGQALAQEQAKPYCACSSPGCEVCHP